VGKGSPSMYKSRVGPGGITSHCPSLSVMVIISSLQSCSSLRLLRKKGESTLQALVSRSGGHDYCVVIKLDD
jgi:hypothetical protein